MHESGRIFLEAAPLNLDPRSIRAELAARTAVAQIHDLHVWEITSGEPAMSAHVLVEPGADCHAARLDLERVLVGDFGISHSTLQVDHVAELTPRPGNPRTRTNDHRSRRASSGCSGHGFSAVTRPSPECGHFWRESPTSRTRTARTRQAHIPCGHF